MQRRLKSLGEKEYQVSVRKITHIYLALLLFLNISVNVNSVYYTLDHSQICVSLHKRTTTLFQIKSPNITATLKSITAQTYTSLEDDLQNNIQISCIP